MANSEASEEKNTIYLIGGTTEANHAALGLKEHGYHVVVSVATPAGRNVAEAVWLEMEVGCKDAAAMESRARALGAAAIVDCSHPFAVAASEQAGRAAAAAGLPYLRYVRSPVAGIDETLADIITVSSFEQAAEQSSRLGGRSLLTIGTRHLEEFVRMQLDFTARILPLPESLADCIRLGVEPEDIIAAWPPFSVDFNRACLRKCGARVLVTKDSGREGGLHEKLEAANSEGVTAVIIRRPTEPGAIHELDELISTLDSLIMSGNITSRS